MRGRSPVTADANKIRHPSWSVSYLDGNTQRFPAREIWLRSPGKGHNGSGPSGWKLKPSMVLARSLADRPGVAELVRKRQIEANKRRS